MCASLAVFVKAVSHRFFVSVSKQSFCGASLTSGMDGSTLKVRGEGEDARLRSHFDLSVWLSGVDDPGLGLWRPTRRKEVY